MLSVLCLLTARPSTAQLLMLLSPVESQIQAGGTVHYAGTIENAGTERIYLNGAGLNFSHPALTGDVTPFFLGAPFWLEPLGDPASSWSGEMFSVSADAELPSGTYIGTFSIYGGTDPFSLDAVAAGSVRLNAVPEPSAAALSAAALSAAAAGVGIFRVRRRKL
jgi:hypothetical protein